MILRANAGSGLRQVPCGSAHHGPLFPATEAWGGSGRQCRSISELVMYRLKQLVAVVNEVLLDLI